MFFLKPRVPLTAWLLPPTCPSIPCSGALVAKAGFIHLRERLVIMLEAFKQVFSLQAGLWPNFTERDFSGELMAFKVYAPNTPCRSLKKASIGFK
jgi:hypothetical protein